MTTIDLKLLMKILQALVATFLQALPQSFYFGNNNNKEHDGSNHQQRHERCPFDVLGLEGGREGTTLEEATKARRRLALKWHPGVCAMIFSVRLYIIYIILSSLMITFVVFVDWCGGMYWSWHIIYIHFQIATWTTQKRPR